MHKIVKTDISFEHNQMEDIKEFSFDRGLAYFTTKDGVYIRTTFPFSVSRTVSLSCGHDVSNYWEDDCGNAGSFPRCRECDKSEPGIRVET